MSLSLILILMCSSFTYKFSTLMHAVLLLEKNIHIQEDLHDGLAYACAAFAADKKKREEVYLKKECFLCTDQCLIQYELQNETIFATITHQKSPHFKLRALLILNKHNNKNTITPQLIN
jgi:hypothetical protein